ncbi:MFS transporter [Aeromonas veronii]|uniref:MFS transporter n=1 Tax=Aeromonas veronii TaxID=654 RepID=UPI0015D57CFD|nr:MFS transporter [Aeromonas veronii]
MDKITHSFTNRLKLLLLGDGLVVFGGWIDYIAILTICVYRFQVDSMEIAIIGASMLLPGIIFTGFISNLVNGCKVLHWLRTSLILRALLTVALLTASNVYIFVAIAVIRSLFNSIATPAISVISARCVPAENRTRYYSLLNMMNSAAKITGPALGGAIASFGRDEYALVISGGLTLAGCFVFWTIKTTTVKDGLDNSPSSKPSTLSNESWNSYAIVMAIFFIAVFMVNNQLPILLRDNGLDKSALGVLVSSSAIGNFLYGLWSARNATSASLKGLIEEILFPAFITMCMFILIAPILYEPFTLQLASLAIIFFVVGLFSSRFAISSNVYLAENFQASLGIAAGRLQAIQNSAMLIAPFIGAFVLSHSSGAFLFVLAGVTGITGLFAVYMMTARKGVKQTLDAKSQE